MPILTAPQIATLRTHPHKIKTYLAVLKPAMMLACQVNDPGGALGKGDRVIPYDNVTHGAFGNVKNGMSLWVGSTAGQQDIGRVRVKSAAAATITVAENEYIDWTDDFFLTVKEIYEFWTVYPRITFEGAPAVLDFFKDYDIDYDDAVAKQNELLNPVPILGPPACAFVDPGTGPPPVATVYFDGQDSYCLGDAIDTYAWLFPGGNPANSALPTPGNVEFPAGTYTISCTVTAVNGKTTTGYRHVFIFNRTGTLNVPYTDFAVKSARCSAKDGGWAHSYEVHGNADATEFPDGTMVVLFAEAYYGDDEKDFGMNHPGRHNIRAVGWIVNESVKKQPETGAVTFNTQGVAGLMKSRENFMCAVDYVSGSPTEWTELKDMDTDIAIFHYLYWHSTIFKMTDVRVSGEIHAACTGPFLIKAQDFARGSIWAGLSRLCDEAFLIPVADRASCLYVDYNPQLLPPDERGNIDTVMLLEHRDRGGDLVLSRLLENKTNFVDFEGIAYDGTDATPVISYAPGRAPEYSGSPKPSKRHVLDPAGDWQAKANLRAGLKLAWDNNEFPNIKWPAAGDYSVADIAPREVFTLTLLAADTKRGIVWTVQKLPVASIQERYDVAKGACQVQFTFEKEALGPAGVTGDYPPDEPPDDPPDPPDPPEPPGEGDGARIVIATDLFGVAVCLDRLASPPVWTAVNGELSGNDLKIVDFILDPWDTDTAIICTETGDVWRNTNLWGGGTWTRIFDASVEGPDPTSKAVRVRKSILDQNFIVLAIEVDEVGDTMALYITHSHTDGGAWPTTVKLTNPNVPTWPESCGVTAPAGAAVGGNIVCSSHDANVVFVGGEAGRGASYRATPTVWKSSDKAHTFPVLQYERDTDAGGWGRKCTPIKVPYSDNPSDLKILIGCWYVISSGKRGPYYVEDGLADVPVAADEFPGFPVGHELVNTGAAPLNVWPPRGSFGRATWDLDHVKLFTESGGAYYVQISEDGGGLFTGRIIQDPGAAAFEMRCNSTFPYNPNMFAMGRATTQSAYLILLSENAGISFGDLTGNLRVALGAIGGPPLPDITITHIVFDWLS